MAFFEVFIPAGGTTSVNVTLTIEAPSWIAALKSGLQKIGDQGNTIKNIMVDIKEDKSIHVSHPKSGRVFKIKEISAEEAAKKGEQAQAAPKPAPKPEAKVPTAPEPAPKPQPKPEPKPAPKPQPKPEPKPAPKPQPKPEPKPAPKPQPKPEPKPAPKPQPKPEPKPAPKPQPKPEPKPAPKPQPKPAPVQSEANQGKITREITTTNLPEITEKIGRDEKYEEFNAEEVLAEVFEKVMDLYLMSREEAIDFIMDLTLDKVKAEAGSIVIADINAGDMYFATARGPVAEQVVKFRMPMGQGIVGFSVQEGVGLAVSEVNKDPRFFKDISDKTGFETRSLLCAPLETQGRCFGAIELVNKTGSDRFSQQELNVVLFLGAKLAEYMLSIE
ncbi:MAG: GAF domain-containing protein [Deltaproteobacteria bacterium]|nr:GAF domain-containing protein [Deltaproteobacteria bacterium]